MVFYQSTSYQRFKKKKTSHTSKATSSRREDEIVIATPLPNRVSTPFYSFPKEEMGRSKSIFLKQTQLTGPPILLHPNQNRELQL